MNKKRPDDSTTYEFSIERVCDTCNSELVLPVICTGTPRSGRQMYNQRCNNCGDTTSYIVDLREEFDIAMKNNKLMVKR